MLVDYNSTTSKKNYSPRDPKPLHTNSEHLENN